MAWLLFLLVTAGVVAIAVWDYRRKAAARAAASRARFEKLFNVQAPAASPVDLTATASTIDSALAPKVPAVTTRDRFLGPAETAAYFLLKTGIPDHEVFAKVPLAAVVAASGEPARRLSQIQLDFVVCDKSMRIVAAIQMETIGTAEALGTQRVLSDALSGSGIRLVRFSPATLPRREEIRALVVGRPGQDAAR